MQGKVLLLAAGASPTKRKAQTSSERPRPAPVILSATSPPGTGRSVASGGSSKLGSSGAQTGGLPKRSVIDEEKAASIEGNARTNPASRTGSGDQYARGPSVPRLRPPRYAADTPAAPDPRAPRPPAEHPSPLYPRSVSAPVLPAPHYPQPAAPQPIYITSAPGSSTSTRMQCFVHCWYYVYILTVLCFMLAIIYIYRLPEFNDQRKLEIEMLRLQVEQTRLETTARVREAEINRDLELDIHKMKLSHDHEVTLEEGKMKERLTEKFMDANSETVERTSGVWNKERVVQRRTFMERTDLVSFSKFLRGEAGLGDVAGMITDRVQETWKEYIASEEPCEGDECAHNEGEAQDSPREEL